MSTFTNTDMTSAWQDKGNMYQQPRRAAYA